MSIVVCCRNSQGNIIFSQLPHATVKGSFPNKDLIYYLLKNYLQEDEDIESQESKFVSSHWQYYGKSFRVQVDSEGNLVALSGTGLGACKWASPFHRFIDQLCILSHLIHLPKKGRILQLRSTAAKICYAMGLDLTLDVLRQVYTAELLERNLPEEMRRRRMHALMIGDGYGILAALIKSILPNSTLVMIDIGKSLLFQAYYCQKAHPACVHEKVENVVDLNSVDFVYCPTEHLEKLERFKFDLATNIASMQEMNTFTVERYFTFLRNNLQLNNLFYCCNRESKTLRGGERAEFMKYPWQDGDRYLVNGYCPWHQYFFSHRRSEKGLCLFGLRVPLVNYYDGKHVHRLAVLATN